LCKFFVLGPVQREYTNAVNAHATAQNKLIAENKHLKNQYKELWYEAHFLAGENFALNQSIDKLARLSLQQSIIESTPLPYKNETTKNN
jgi:hypothetical protein